jgi:hypothetical protein
MLDSNAWKLTMLKGLWVLPMGGRHGDPGGYGVINGMQANNTNLSPTVLTGVEASRPARATSNVCSLGAGYQICALRIGHVVLPMDRADGRCLNNRQTLAFCHMFEAVWASEHESCSHGATPVWRGFHARLQRPCATKR